MQTDILLQTNFCFYFEGKKAASHSSPTWFECFFPSPFFQHCEKIGLNKMEFESGGKLQSMKIQNSIFKELISHPPQIQPNARLQSLLT
jgi:hypothetical protein